MNNRIMPKWSEVKDVNGINLHLFDAVQVITSGNKRHNQTGRIMALLKTKPYLQMVEVLFQDEKRSNFLTASSTGRMCTNWSFGGTAHSSRRIRTSCFRISTASTTGA